MVDDIDIRLSLRTQRNGECLLWVGGKDREGYGRFRRNGRYVFAHRAAFEKARGPIPSGKVVDHSCHNKACVEPGHLRLASRQENLRNLRGANSASATGVRGVTVLSDGSIRGRVRCNGRDHEKRFATIESAAEWVAAKRRELFGEFAGGN